MSGHRIVELAFPSRAASVVMAVQAPRWQEPM
jgi:hypothetical protein